jgi:hypothetical protein
MARRTFRVERVRSEQESAMIDHHNQKRTGTLVDRLELMFEWYKGMVDERTGRLLYTYDPETGLAVGDGEPIRDIAAVWDVEVLSAFLSRDDLLNLIRRSLDHFEQRWFRVTATRSSRPEGSLPPSRTARSWRSPWRGRTVPTTCSGSHCS